VTDVIESVGEVKSTHDNIGIILKKASYSLEEVNKTDVVVALG